MENGRFARLVIVALIAFGGVSSAIAAGDVEAQGPWSLGLREGGQGFYLTSPDQMFQLNFLGYGQFLGGMYLGDYQGAPDRPDYPVGFQVRRARLAMLATLYRNYELFVEFGTPTLRGISGSAIPGGSAPVIAAPGSVSGHTYPRGTDFGIVEARVTARLFDEALQLRFGKFVGPFSAENARSSRNLDTIERSSILNSMHSFPALDTQIGIMLFGRFLDGVVNYYFALFNGNADSYGTPLDENGEKEFQFKAVFVPSSHLNLGIGYDNEFTGLRLFSVVDHAFVPVVSGGAVGRRHGLEVDLSGEWDWFSMMLEGMGFYFPNAPNGTFLRTLYGATLQFGWQLAGDKVYGLQLITRGEWTHSLIEASRDLYSAILGFNIFINANVRNQVNYIMEIPSGQAIGTGVYGSGHLQHIVYDELQIKF